MSIQRSTACFPMSSSTLSSFRVPSNPISNSSFWQPKTGWWKLCKCTLFVMLFFLHTSTSCLFNTPKQWWALALVQKGDSCKECIPGALIEWYLVLLRCSSKSCGATWLITTLTVLICLSLVQDYSTGISTGVILASFSYFELKDL